jgi:hypothetical protein
MSSVVKHWAAASQSAHAKIKSTLNGQLESAILRCIGILSRDKRVACWMLQWPMLSLEWYGHKVGSLWALLGTNLSSLHPAMYL